MCFENTESYIISVVVDVFGATSLLYLSKKVMPLKFFTALTAVTVIACTRYCS